MIHTLSIGATVAYGPLLVALLVAMVAGTISFLSPCCLPLLPGYLAYVTGAAGADAADGRRQRLGPQQCSALRVLGFAAVFTGFGALLGALGSTLIRHQDVLIRILGILTIILGLMFAGEL